jgi:hypothetical protein
MTNIVEVIADDQADSPCKHGNIVEGHACYCHHPDRANKCPIWKNFGVSDLTKWHRREWPLFKVPMLKGWDGDVPIVQNEMRPMMPNDNIGGCPSFEPQ